MVPAAGPLHRPASREGGAQRAADVTFGTLSPPELAPPSAPPQLSRWVPLGSAGGGGLPWASRRGVREGRASPAPARLALRSAAR